jgi:hypothetical protein
MTTFPWTRSPSRTPARATTLVALEVTAAAGRFGPTDRPSPGRQLLALALHAASRLLGRLARHIARQARRRPRADPVYEFYAEAGAPEGALYVDGQLVGHVDGVTRL